MIPQGMFQGNKQLMQFRVCDTGPHRASSEGKDNPYAFNCKITVLSLCRSPLLGYEPNHSSQLEFF